MNREVLEKQAIYLEFLKNYEYINDQGRLDLEAFCGTLSGCFSYDGVLKQSPQPRDMYDLLLEMLESYSENDEMSLWVQSQKLTDWTPEAAHIYPDKCRTYIHITGLIYVMSHWIYGIGHTLMGIPEPETTTKYFDWICDEWVFTYTFINGFHNDYMLFLKNIDKQASKKNGYSAFEALHKSISSDTDFAQAANELQQRNTAQHEAMERIREAIEAGFYLEAITLQENLISNCIYNYLKAKKKKLNNPSFQKLLIECKKKVKGRGEMIDEINNWRIKRNVAIHGFIESRIDSLSIANEDFLYFSKQTSIEGLVFCKNICDWYTHEAVHFIPTEFEKDKKRLN